MSDYLVQGEYPMCQCDEVLITDIFNIMKHQPILMKNLSELEKALKLSPNHIDLANQQADPKEKLHWLLKIWVSEQGTNARVQFLRVIMSEMKLVDLEQKLSLLYPHDSSRVVHDKSCRCAQYQMSYTPAQISPTSTTSTTPYPFAQTSMDDLSRQMGNAKVSNSVKVYLHDIPEQTGDEAMVKYVVKTAFSNEVKAECKRVDPKGSWYVPKFLTKKSTLPRVLEVKMKAKTKFCRLPEQSAATKELKKNAVLKFLNGKVSNSKDILE